MRSGVSRKFCESCKSCSILSTPPTLCWSLPPQCLRVSYHELTPEEREIVKGNGKWEFANARSESQFVRMWKGKRA